MQVPNCANTFSCGTGILPVKGKGRAGYHWCQLKTRATGSRGYKNEVRRRGLTKKQGF